MGQAGEVAITDFQRSFVWQNDKVAKYIKAIFDGKPVGLFLILEAADTLQFKPRTYNKIDIPLNNVGELILDGQQRMTSLLQALNGQSEKRFFIELSDISSNHLKVSNIIFFDKNTIRAQECENPKAAYDLNLIPLEVLRDVEDNDGLSPLAHWCLQVAEQVGLHESRVLESKIKRFVDESFFWREIWYCLLPKTIDRSTATEIFIETNTSSVRIRRFDIEVANARGEHDEDLRDSISAAYSNPKNSVFRHYFKEDPEDWIPEIGEWMLKVSCLHNDQAPREKNYPNALGQLLKRKDGDNFPYLEQLYADLSWALNYASEQGAPTRRTVPSWPPLHVIAAIRPSYEQIRDPGKINIARSLLKTYYWRSLFSNRYDVQANDRLHNDFRALKSALHEINKQGEWKIEIPLFEDKDHPIYTHNDFLRHAGWIGSQSRLGRALASFVMSRQPSDWITGECLSPNKIRELEEKGELDRHHVFSRHILKMADIPRDKIENGLNGVFLDGKTNRRFSKDAPEVYLEKVLQNYEISEDELRSRIERYLVPYNEMKDVGKIVKRYDRFLLARAKSISQHIDKLGRIRTIA